MIKEKNSRTQNMGSLTLKERGGREKERKGGKEGSWGDRKEKKRDLPLFRKLVSVL